MASVILWATLLTPSVVDVLILGLVKAGYQVAHTSAGQSLTGKHCTLCSLRVISEKEPGTDDSHHSMVIEEAKRILLDYCYFSLIAKEGAGSSWYGEHFPEVPEAPPKAALDRIAEDASILEDED